MNSKLLGVFWFLFAGLLAFYFADGIHFVAKVIPWKYEEKLGADLNSNFEYLKCNNSQIKSDFAFKRLISRIYPIKGLDDADEIKIDFNIIQKKEVNAFATLGGKIYINSGLIDDVNSPEELAGVLAHEIAHVKERHILQGVIFKLIIPSTTTKGDLFLNLGFSKSEEKMADYLGLERLKLAKVGAFGFYEFFKRHDGDSFKILNLLSDHPGSQSRKELAQEYLKYTHEELLNKTEWADLKQLCH